MKLVLSFMILYSVIINSTIISSVWNNYYNTKRVELCLNLGSWYLEFDSGVDYQIGDRFIFQGILYEVRRGGGTNNPPSQSNLKPFGIYQEVTDEYREFNTYFKGDIVLFEGYYYTANNATASFNNPSNIQSWTLIGKEEG